MLELYPCTRSFASKSSFVLEDKVAAGLTDKSPLNYMLLYLDPYIQGYVDQLFRTFSTYQFEYIDLSDIDFSTIVGVDSLFRGNENIRKVVGTIKAPNCKYLENMFANCKNLEHIELTDCVFSDDIADMDAMFVDCPKLKYVAIDGLCASDHTFILNSFENTPELKAENIHIGGMSDEKLKVFLGDKAQ